MMTNKVLKAEIAAWIVFAIPTAFIVYSIYAIIDIAQLQGQPPNIFVLFAPIINILTWFFTSRYLVERTKRNVQQEEIDRLKKLLGKEYPDKLEDFKPSGESTP